MTCYPPGFICTLIEDTSTLIEWNFSSGGSDEFFVWWRKFLPTNSFARQSFARLGTLRELAKIGTDNCYTKVKKSTKFQSNDDIFDGNKVMSDNLWRHNSVNRDDIIPKLFQFASLYRAYLLVKFHNDRRSRTCWTTSPSLWIGLVRQWHFFNDYDVIIQQ